MSAQYGSAYTVKGDPHWITTKYPGQCAACQGRIPAGARAFYFPKGKHLECSRCGETSARRFEAEVADEWMSGGWNNY